MLSNFATPITSGLVPARHGELSRQRAETLDRRLRDLDTARRRAHVESRGYPVGLAEAREAT